MIRGIRREEWDDCISVIRQSFRTVAREFQITEENCPGHTSFFSLSRLEGELARGARYYGYFTTGRMIGVVSLCPEKATCYALNHLAVLPGWRHHGVGEALMSFSKEKVRRWGGTNITIGIIEESTCLKDWYIRQGFIHTGSQKFDHLPFAVGFLEWTV